LNSIHNCFIIADHVVSLFIKSVLLPVCLTPLASIYIDFAIPRSGI